MIDLTTRKEDKDTFITKVYIKDNDPMYCVVYASGRVQEFPFSLHNLNATLYLMERQFYEYKEDFYHKKAKEANSAVVHKLVEGLLAIIGIALTVAFDMSLAVKGFMILAILIVSLIYQKSETIRNHKCGRYIDILSIAERYLKNKDQFKVQVLDPVTNQMEDYYLFTLSDIESVEDELEITLLGEGLTEEVKKEESEKNIAILKKKWNLGE